MRSGGFVDAGKGGWYPVLDRIGGEGVPLPVFGEGGGYPPIVLLSGGYPPFE